MFHQSKWIILSVAKCISEGKLTLILLSLKVPSKYTPYCVTTTPVPCRFSSTHNPMYFSPLWNTHKNSVMVEYLSPNSPCPILTKTMRNLKSTWWCRHTLRNPSSCHGPSGRWKRWRTSSPASRSSACRNRVAALRWNSLRTPRRWRTWAECYILVSPALSDMKMASCQSPGKPQLNKMLLATLTCICRNHGSSHLSSVHGNCQACSALCWVLRTPRNWRRISNFHF